MFPSFTIALDVYSWPNAFKRSMWTTSRGILPGAPTVLIRNNVFFPQKLLRSLNRFQILSVYVLKDTSNNFLHASTDSKLHWPPKPSPLKAVPELRVFSEMIVKICNFQSFSLHFCIGDINFPIWIASDYFHFSHFIEIVIFSLTLEPPRPQHQLPP